MTPRMLFCNLGSDVARCLRAAKEGSDEQFEQALIPAYRTLQRLQSSKDSSAYEEGVLLLFGLHEARSSSSFDDFSSELDAIILAHMPHLS